jgi:hypothetical protein
MSGGHRRQAGVRQQSRRLQGCAIFTGKEESSLSRDNTFTDSSREKPTGHVSSHSIWPVFMLLTCGWPVVLRQVVHLSVSTHVANFRGADMTLTPLGVPCVLSQ